MAENSSGLYGVLDTHYHLDFIASPVEREAFLYAVQQAGVQVVAQTVLPTGFETIYDEFASKHFPVAPLLSLGFHPWWITSQEQAGRELQVFFDCLAKTPWIGEIGLDFSPRRLEQASKGLQIWVFRQILEHIAAGKQVAHRVLSIHAVRAVDVVLDLLEETDITLHGAIPVLHRFGGTSDELTRLMRIGGYLSVHEMMLETKRGRAYVRQIPASRLLLESDLPAHADDSRDGARLGEELMQRFSHTEQALSQLRGEDMHEVLRKNQQRIYGI